MVMSRARGRRLLGGLRWHSHGGHGHSHGSSDFDEAEAKEALSREDAKAADRITWIGVYINVVLSTTKGVAGVMFHSAGLLADAVHSMSDLVSDGITLLALKYCTRPPDQFQPYGYGKYETVGALSVSLLLVSGSLGIINHSFDTLMVLVEPGTASSFAALDAQLSALAIDTEVAEAIKSSIYLNHGGASHHHSHDVVMHPAALGIAAVSVAAKEALYRATMIVGKRINSSVLIANAWHHRSDALSSVVAMGGISLSLMGFPIFDPIAGMLVGGIILKMGGEVGWDAIKDLCDAQLPAKTVQKLHAATQSVLDASNGEIVAVRQLRSRKIGRHLHVDLTLVMRDGDEPVTFEQACEWKQRVKDAIQRDVPRVKDMIIELATSAQASSTVFDYDHREEAHNHGHGHSHSHRHGHGHGSQ
jgi:cation diffusion facilitator family transporter